MDTRQNWSGQKMANSFIMCDVSASQIQLQKWPLGVSTVSLALSNIGLYYTPLLKRINFQKTFQHC